MNEGRLKFRGSRAGSCLRELVAAELQPHTVKPDPARVDFLRAGHYLQEHVIDILMEEGIRISHSEAEGVHDRHYYTIVGHVDGVYWGPTNPDEPVDIPPSLLEVKAIKDGNFQRLKGAEDWRSVYGYYQPQAQCYLNFPDVGDGFGDVVGGPFAATYFIFYNRNTSDLVGSVPGVDRPNYTYRPDIVIERNEIMLQEIFAKHDEAYEWIMRREVPQFCSRDGWCYFCRNDVPKRN